MTLYETFRRLDLDFSQIGLHPGNEDLRYFCTPRGAEIIGWAGVDGIHYCFIKGFGEMVFSVAPMNLPGEYVHPLAGSFEDFLRLLLACNSLDVMEQAYRMDRAAFGCEVWESGFLEDGQVQARKTLQNGLSLTPMPEPYHYIKELQASFDYSTIPYTEEYTVWGPEESGPDAKWAVYFDCAGHSRPGKEIPVHKQFTWGGKRWQIPSIYICGAGLVLDFCLEVEPEQAVRDRPLFFNFSTKAVINSRTLRWTHGVGFQWLPLSVLPGGERPAAADAQVVRHYRLDPSKGWSVQRISLPWATKRTPKFRHIKLRLEPDPEHFPGPRFTAPEVGGSFRFTHPVFGTEHTFTVLDYKQQALDPEYFQDQEMEYPCHYAAMTYDISPDIPRDRISIQDCDRGGSPRPRNPQPGTLGSSCGVLLAAVRGESRAAASSLYFEPAEQVEWQMTFFEKMQDGMDVEISLDGNNE